MAALNVNKAEFIKSAAAPAQFVQSSVPAVVFAGKSNVGKSSVINRLLNRRNFARVGSAPGKTVHVNYFLIDGRLYLVDLPGYGGADAADRSRGRVLQLSDQPGRLFKNGFETVVVRDLPGYDRSPGRIAENAAQQRLVADVDSDARKPVRLERQQNRRLAAARHTAS